MQVVVFKVNHQHFLFETLPKNSILVFKNLKIKNLFAKLFLKLQF